jgi:hypothetical protein
LGHSTYKNDKIKKALAGKGLIEEFTVNLGHATKGIIKLLEIKMKGYEVLRMKAPPSREHRCSAEHWFWQRNIADYYKSKGFHTEIEMSIRGKRADVGFLMDGMTVAVEVGLSPKNEVVNVQKDLEAGFDKILVACKTTKIKRAVQERLEGLISEDDWKKVKLILLSNFSFLKELYSK